MSEVGEDIPLVDGDACGREDAAVFGFRDERTHDGNASRVGRDGVVDGVVREEGHRWAAHVVGGASDGPSSGTGEVGSVRMDAQYHVGCPIDLASIRMRRDKGQETVKAGHSGEGGGGLFRGESAGRSEDASVHAAPVVEQVAYRYLQFLGLGGCGWGRKVRPSGGLGGPGTIGGGGVDGRGRGRADTVGAKAGEEGGDIARVR